MQRQSRFHELEIAVAAGVIVRPGNAGSLLIIRDKPFGVGLRILGVEVIRCADPAECTKGDSQVLMIARSEDCATTPTESGDRCAILRAEAFSGIHAEKPKLIEASLVEL